MAPKIHKNEHNVKSLQNNSIKPTEQQNKTTKEDNKEVITKIAESAATAVISSMMHEMKKSMDEFQNITDKLKDKENQIMTKHPAKISHTPCHKSKLNI